MIYVGDFISKSGTLRISDPCYDKDTWCAGVVSNCVKGEWEAFIEKREISGWGTRVLKLIVKAKGHEADERDLLPIDVGVDSGQAGVFDEGLFKSNMKKAHKLTGNKEYSARSYILEIEQVRELIKETGASETLQKQLDKKIARLEAFDSEELKFSKEFYEVCCDKTLGDMSAGTVEYGAVSSSGLGDGSYAAFAGKNKAGQICEIEIDFQLDDENDGEEYE